MALELSASTALQVGARPDRLPATRWQVLIRGNDRHRHVLRRPVVIGATYAVGHLGTAFVVLGGVSLLGALVAGLAAEETARRPLEVISP
jgi:hypothetical protein